MDKHAFLNRIRSLHSIDRDQLPELSEKQWLQYCSNPAVFLIRADDPTAEAIWREVEKRQRV